MDCSNASGRNYCSKDSETPEQSIRTEEKAVA